MIKDSVRIRFDTPTALGQEFEKNISNRGIFVATELDFEVRQRVDIEIYLEYAEPTDGDEDTPALTLPGEIVHCIPLGMAASGAMPGVAVQFDHSAGELREAFEPLLEVAAAESAENAESKRDLDLDLQAPDTTEEEKVGRDRRGAKREAVRVPVRIMPTMSPPFEATSRDLSASGILLSVKTVVLPIGEVVRTCLWHPSGNPSVEIDGRVVREIKNKNGRIAAVAIAFDRTQAADPRTHDVIDALRHAGHRSRLGGISGSIVDLGLANMLQMFGSSAPQGTVVVERDGEQGWVAFADAAFLGAELGALSDHEALVAMLDWGDGRFQFEATADAELVATAERRPLDAVVFEAVCALDERGKSGDSAGEDDETEDTIAIAETTTFFVDVEQEEVSRPSLDKTEDAVLELAKSGMAVEKLKTIIPEPSEAVDAALLSLAEMGVLIPR